MKERLRLLAGNRMISDDVLLIDSREHRTQAQNREAARARLAALLEHAARSRRSDGRPSRKPPRAKSGSRSKKKRSAVKQCGAGLEPGED